MAYEYTTSQGYAVKDSGRRVVVDPVTRIEGHLRCEVNLDDSNVITNAVSCGTIFRGIEIILKGRDPRDAALVITVLSSRWTSQRRVPSMRVTGSTTTRRPESLTA